MFTFPLEGRVGERLPNYETPAWHKTSGLSLSVLSDVVACRAHFTGHPATIRLRVVSNDIQLNGSGGK